MTNKRINLTETVKDGLFRILCLATVNWFDGSDLLSGTTPEDRDSIQRAMEWLRQVIDS
jgi:hypothetical protein